MTVVEKCKKIRRMLLNRAASVMVYRMWDSVFAQEEIMNFPETLREQVKGKEFFDIDPSDLTRSEMVDLGFGSWSDETEMMLIPLWLFPFMADGLEVEDIFGETFIFNKADADTDNRFGCLSYGVVPKKD